MRLGCLAGVVLLAGAGAARADLRPAGQATASSLAVRALGPARRPTAPAAKRKPAGARAKKARPAQQPKQATRTRRSGVPSTRVARASLAPGQGAALLLVSPWTQPPPASHGAGLPIGDPAAGRAMEDLVHAISTEPRVLDLAELLGAQGLQRPDPTWKGPVQPLAAVRPDRAVFGVQGTF